MPARALMMADSLRSVANIWMGVLIALSLRYSKRQMATEQGSSPVAQAGIHIRMGSVDRRFFSRAGKIFFDSAEYSVGSLKNVVTLISRSLYSRATSSFFSRSRRMYCSRLLI